MCFPIIVHNLLHSGKVARNLQWQLEGPEYLTEKAPSNIGELAHVAAVSSKTHLDERVYRSGLCFTAFQGDYRQELLLQSSIDLLLAGAKQLIRVTLRKKRNHSHRIKKRIRHREVWVIESPYVVSQE